MLSALPSVVIDGGAGTSSSFEVIVIRPTGTQLVYSKLATGRFPDFTQLAAAIAAA